MRTDPFERTSLRISTWIYLILLCLSMIIIVLFTWLSVRIESKTFGNPTLAKFEELQEEYPRSLQCPCSQIAIPYGSFISIFPQFHPVCTSWFTSDQWIEDMGKAYKSESGLHPDDVFQLGGKFFTSLKTSCKLMRTIVSDASFIFNESSLITDQVLSDIEFMARAQQILNQFKSNIAAESKRSLALIRSQIATMYTTGETDVAWQRSYLRDSSYSTYFQAVATKVGNCSCRLNDVCKRELVLVFDNFPFGYKTILNNSNIFWSCFAIQALLQSSLEFFFNESYTDLLISEMSRRLRLIDNKWANLSVLQRNSTRFSPNMLVEGIINEMMIETWGDKISYVRYYEQCAPKLCTSSFTSRNNALYVFTTMIGLFGGLSVALRIIVPRIVTWIRNRKRRRVETNGMTGLLIAQQISEVTCFSVSGSPTFCKRAHALWQLIKREVVELNLFETEVSWDDQNRRRYEIITTRIYLLLLAFSVVILVVYTAVTVQTESFTNKYPSQSYFEEHASNPRYSPTLDCPCRNISIPYNSFTLISLHYHQLCSSDFVTHNSLWINLAYYGSDLRNYSYVDYRHFVVPHFRLLFYLCTLANDTVTDALSIFHSNTFISKRAQSRQAIVAQMEDSVNQFCSSIPQTFMRTLDFIRQMAQGNGLVSSIGSNWYPIVSEYLMSLGKDNFISMASRSYGDNNCSCGTNSKCASSATIDGSIVPGFLVGCYPLESLLQSTLECLYNITCINKLKNPNQSSNITIHPLNSTLSSPNATVQSLMDALMIDRWEPNIVYEDYYAACAPLSCTYVIKGRTSPIYIITTIIGFFGGLTVAGKIIVPVLMKIGQYLIMCRRQRVEPNVAVIA